MQRLKDWLRLLPLSLSACGALLTAPGCTQFPSVLSSPREEVQAKLSEARMHESRGQEEQAAELYRSALAHDLHSVDAHRRLGLLAAKHRRWDEAEGHFQAALKVRPNDSRLLADYGYLLYRQDRLLEAERTTRVALESDPDNGRIINNLALIVGRQGRYQESLILFRQAGNEAQAQNNLAYLYAQRGEVELAEAAYVKSIQLDGKNRPAGMALVQLCDAHAGRSSAAPVASRQNAADSPRLITSKFHNPGVQSASHALPLKATTPAEVRTAADSKPAEVKSRPDCAAPAAVEQPSIRSRQMAEQSREQPAAKVPATPAPCDDAVHPVAPVVQAPAATPAPVPAPVSKPVESKPTFSAPMRPATPVTPATVGPPVKAAEVKPKVEEPTKTASNDKQDVKPSITPVEPKPVPKVEAPVKFPAEATPREVSLPTVKPAPEQKPAVLPVPLKTEEPKPLPIERPAIEDQPVEAKPLPTITPATPKEIDSAILPDDEPETPPLPTGPNLLRTGPNAAAKPKVTPAPAPQKIQPLPAQPAAVPHPFSEQPLEPESEYPVLRNRDQSQKAGSAKPQASRSEKPVKPVTKADKIVTPELLEEDIAQLAELLQRGNPEQREAAATALGEFGPQAASAVPALIEALVDSNKGIRRAAGIALEKIEKASQVEDDGVVPTSGPELQFVPTATPGK